jgi:hypothetical protein
MPDPGTGRNMAVMWALWADTGHTGCTGWTWDGQRLICGCGTPLFELGAAT